MSELVNYYNQLPPYIATWREAWTHVKDAGLRVSVSFPDFEGYEIVAYYNIHIDYIKAKCWDEVQVNLPTLSDVYKIERCFHSMHYEPITNKEFNEILDKLTQIRKHCSK